jgi:hypothetical protein
VTPVKVITVNYHYDIGNKIKTEKHLAYVLFYLQQRYTQRGDDGRAVARPVDQEGNIEYGAVKTGMTLDVGKYGILKFATLSLALQVSIEQEDSTFPPRAFVF